MLDLSEALVNQVAERVRGGEWPAQVAIRLGITRSQFRTWWQAGEEHQDRWHADDFTLTEHQQLCAMLVYRTWVAEAECENGWLTDLKATLKPDRAQTRAQWQGIVVLLERRFPDRWRKREMVREVKAGESAEDEFRRMTDPEAARKALEG